MILVDSSVWIDYFNGKVTKKSDLLEGFLGVELILMGDLILTEILQGFRKENDFKKAKKLLLTFPLRQMVGRNVAIEAANNYRLLKKKGITVRKTIDVLIATFCISNKLPLLHDDRDFDPFEKHLKLKVV